MAFDDPENPRIMEDFIRALGAEPVIYPYRNDVVEDIYPERKRNVTEICVKRLKKAQQALVQIC